MSWQDQGFSNYLIREFPTASTAQKPLLSQDEVDSVIEGVSGSKITSGISRSKDGKLKVNWDEGTIEFSDGAKTYLIEGKQDDGTFGFRLFDTRGNQISMSMIELKQGQTIAPGGTGTARLFVERVASTGKYRLVVQFQTGDVRVLASQL